MSDLFKFLYVTACFIIALSQRKSISAKDGRILKTALFFTVTADFFMVLLKKEVPGLCFFIVVQALYNYRYWEVSSLRVVLEAAALAVISGVIFGYVIGLGVVYGFLSLSSIRGVLSWRKKAPFLNGMLAAWGMTLFAVCDIFVALTALSIVPFSAAGVVIWSSYMPSQLMLSLSGRRFDFKRSKNTAYTRLKT